jgi:hypothetical protein
VKPELKPRAAREHEPITVERLERAVALCAYLVVRDGPVMVPMFERLERELAAMRQTQDAVERAKRFRRLRWGSIIGEWPQQVGHLVCLLFPRFRFLVCLRSPRPQDERAADEGEADDHQWNAKSAHVASLQYRYFTPQKRVRRSKMRAISFLQRRKWAGPDKRRVPPERKSGRDGNCFCNCRLN